MTRGQRRTHAIIWLLLGVLTLGGLTWAVQSRAPVNPQEAAP